MVSVNRGSKPRRRNGSRHDVASSKGWLRWRTARKGNSINTLLLTFPVAYEQIIRISGN